MDPMGHEISGPPVLLLRLDPRTRREHPWCTAWSPLMNHMMMMMGKPRENQRKTMIGDCSVMIPLKNRGKGLG